MQANTQANPIVFYIEAPNLEIRSVLAADGGKSYFESGKYEDECDILSAYLTDELQKAGGLALFEVGTGGVSGCWYPPDFDLETAPQVVYLAHFLQSGLLKDSTHVIAATAYTGGGEHMCKSLAAIHASGKNSEMAARDAYVLTRVAPLLGEGWFTYALIQMDNGLRDQSVVAWNQLLEICPEDHLAMKYLAICLSVKNPSKAVGWMERGIRVQASKGLVPDAHTRIAYGMALRAAKLLKEAKVQFSLVEGVDMSPKMTVKQWVDWGYKLGGSSLEEALKKPIDPTRKISPK